MTLPTIITEALGGGALARRLIAGDAPAAWYVPRPTSGSEWRDRAIAVRESIPANWLSAIAPAFGATGSARERLERVANGAGVVVTTGQQPGLFGGPVYTWSKALAALELADALERETGIPTAPVFWAATDDADFREASDTWIALAGGAERLVMEGPAQEGVTMSEHPLGDVSAALERLTSSAGSAVDPGILDIVRQAYRSGQSVGNAYLVLLRALLNPFGIAVLDASHPALVEAERPILTRALRRAPAVAEALLRRGAEMRAVGYEPQVADVEGLTLVFGREDGRKARISLRLADQVAERGSLERLSPNVLLRPVVERAVLPTVAYVAGPGEITYFAQVGAVASALDADAPLVVPRWSCTIIEPHIEALMTSRGIRPSEVHDRHALEGRLARQLAPAEVLRAIDHWRERIGESAATLAAVLDGDQVLLSREVIDGTRRQMQWRADRLERRFIAALKRRDDAMLRDVGTVAGALHPGGSRQERALNLLPILARYGLGVLDAMREGARRHADALVRGQVIPVDRA